MKTMKDYHELFLKYDAFLFADVFDKFRNNSSKNYGLCPSLYLSAPAISQDKILNITKAELKSIPDPDMFIFIEKGMRSGVSYISNRYSKANYKYLMSYYSKQIIYLDENNFYGYAMSKFLLTSGFKWIDLKSLT